MLKKHGLSIVEGSASFVLAAPGGSTYRTEYAFASSLAAAALDSLFDHPAGCSDATPVFLECCVAPVPKGFCNNLLDRYAFWMKPEKPISPPLREA